MLRSYSYQQLVHALTHANLYAIAALSLRFASAILALSLAPRSRDWGALTLRDFVRIY